MESVRETEPLRKLNTKGCCFLCLKTENINEIEDPDNTQVLKSTSIRFLLLHLQILVQSANGGSSFGEDYKKEEIQVDLCENCGQMTSRFSVLFQKLNKIQLEMDYFLERIHQSILESSKNPELVQNYSKRMTSDLEALSQLAFVDNLRKQVAKESSQKSTVPRLQLILTRVNSKIIKTEIIEETSESNGQDFQGNYFSDEISPPPSPNSTANTEGDLSDPLASPLPSPNPKEVQDEKLKFCPSASTVTENVKLSPSLKPPIKQKSKFYTEDSFTGLYKCNKCEKKSKNKTTLIHHYKNDHLKLRYKCDICNIAVLKELPLKKHKQSCRKNLEKKFARETDPNFKFICKICGKRFNKQDILNNHRLLVHKNVDRYSCDLCDKKFKKSEHLKNHRNAVHFGKKFYCGFCNKSFSYSSGLRSHKMKCPQKLSLKEEAEKLCV